MNEDGFIEFEGARLTARKMSDGEIRFEVYNRNGEPLMSTKITYDEAKRLGIFLLEVATGSDLPIGSRIRRALCRIRWDEIVMIPLGLGVALNSIYLILLCLGFHAK